MPNHRLAGDRLQEKRLLGVLLVAAALAMVLAVTLNILLRAPAPVAADQSNFPAGGSSGVPEVVVDTPAIDRLPANVTGFETVTRQAVPGQGERVAEAVYVTLDMMLESQVTTGSYARVEVFGSPGDARVRIAELIAQYSVRPEEILLNGVVKARAGYTASEGAFAIVWIYGNNAVLAKSQFKDSIPVRKREMLRGQALALAERIDVFQRLGREGVTAVGSDGADQ